MPEKRKKYDREFREGAVRIVDETRPQAIRVGEGGDEVSVARFIADQRTKYQVPHTVTCLLLGVSLA